MGDEREFGGQKARWQIGSQHVRLPDWQSPMWVEESTGESIVMLWPHLLFATENKESLEGEKEFAADVALPQA